MASWGVWNSRLAAMCSLTAMNIHREAGSVANASFTTTGVMAVGDTVAFRAYVGPTSYITALTGSILSCKQNAQKMFVCQAVENNDDLRYYQAEYAGSRVIDISNSGHTLRIRDYVARIISGTGWTDGTLDSSVYIPNTTDYLPSIRISNSYVSSALDKFLKNTCGYDIWYDSTTKTIYYGEFRVDRTAATLKPLYSERTTSDVQHNVARVIVYGATNATFGVKIKSGAVAPYRTLMYRYSDAADSTECEKIAAQILNDRQYTLDRYESVFNVEALFAAMPSEGDKVHVESPDIGLHADKGVKDVTFSLMNVTLGLGYPAITVFDLLGDKLVMIGGTADTGTELTWDGGWQHVDTDATTGPATWKIAIDDLSLIGDDFTLELHLHKWVKDLSTLPSLAGMIADGHISGVSAYRALAGMAAAKALAGMTALKALSGVSAGKALAGVSVNDMNTCGSVVSINYIDANSIAITSYVGYVQICADTEIGDTATGRSFGILRGTLSVYNNTANWVKWYLDIRQPAAGSILDRPIIIDIPPSGGSNQYHTIPFMCLLPWSASLTTDDRTFGVYAKKYNSGQNNITCYGAQITVMQVGRHSHNITEPNTNTGHLTTINEPNTNTGHNTSLSEPNTGTGHNTTLSEPNAGNGHNTSVNDPSHDHTLEEPNDHTGHNTNEDDTKTEVDSFPEDVDIYVNDVKINSTSFPGGVDETIEQIIPKTAFVEGENTIMVKSTKKGSVYAFGLYTQYGSG